MYLYTDLYCHKLLVKRERTPFIFTVLRKVLNILLFWLSLFFLLLFALATREFFPLLLAVVFLTTAVPIIMGSGVSAILRERFIAESYARRGLPLKYDIKKIINGYAKIFPVLWIFPPACVLLPGGGLYIAVLPPILLMSILVLKLIEHTWLIFGFSKKKYWLMHLCVLAALFFGAALARTIIGY